MDRSLDDIVMERKDSRGPRAPRRGGRRNDRYDYPRDGVRKSTRDESQDLDAEWVHDKFNDNSMSSRVSHPPRRQSPRGERSYGGPSAKLRVTGIHYDLAEADIHDLFERIGRVAKLELLYDRAGRSQGIAYVTYEQPRDAEIAIREFDGANANGQPIFLTPAPVSQPRTRRNPFDDAVVPGRSLEDRITRAPAHGRERSYSPYRHSDVSGPPPPNVDRYVPGDRSLRSRSPRPRRREGRPPGGRRERGDRAEGGRPARRPKKTQEELDAELDAYYAGAKSNGGAEGTENTAPTVAPASADQGGDIDMIL